MLGGLSGPAIKPIALRAVYQVAQAVGVPLVGIGGIASIDDVMEFLVAGATAVQIGTANFYNPQATIQLLDALGEADTLARQDEVMGFFGWSRQRRPAGSEAARARHSSASAWRKCAPPDEVYRRPSDRFVASFVGDVNVLPARLDRIEAALRGDA